MPNYRSLFRYPGSKWNLMSTYVRLFPEHHHYISVFGGSATDILRKTRSAQETLNDLDPRIWNLFRVLQDDRLTERLKAKISIPYCRFLYHDALVVDKAPIDDPVDAAAAFLIVTGQGMCSSHRRQQRQTAWTPIRSRGYLSRWLRLPENH